MKNWITLAAAVLLVVMAFASAAAMDPDQAVQHLADRMISKQKGNIAQIKGDRLYVALGEKDGILEGSQFEVVRLGDPIHDGERLIGHEEKIIGKAEAWRVRDQMTVAKIQGTLERPRKGDLVYLASSPVTRVVVAPFLYDNKVTGLTRSLQENLITALLRKGMAVVERSQLEQVLKEQKLGYSGLVKLDSARKLGQLLGADAMVLGSLRDLGDTVDVNARLVALESGTGLNGAQARIAKTPVVASLLKQTLVEGGDGQAGMQGEDPPQNEENGPKPKIYQNDLIRIEAVSLTRQASGMVLSLRFTNLTNEVYEVGAHWKDSCYLADANGRRYLCKKLSWADENFYGRFELVPGITRLESIQLSSGENTIREFTYTTKYGVDRRRGSDPEFYVVIKDIGLR